MVKMMPWFASNLPLGLGGGSSADRPRPKPHPASEIGTLAASFSPNVEADLAFLSFFSGLSYSLSFLEK